MSLNQAGVAVIEKGALRIGRRVLPKDVEASCWGASSGRVVEAIAWEA